MLIQPSNSKKSLANRFLKFSFTYGFWTKKKNLLGWKRVIIKVEEEHSLTPWIGSGSVWYHG